MDAQKVVGAALRAARGHADLTQLDVSKRLIALGAPMDRAAVARIENGTRDVRVGELLALAAALEVSPAHLLTPLYGGALDVGEHRLTAARVRAWLSGDPDALHRTTATLEDIRRAAQAHRDLAALGDDLEVLTEAVQRQDGAAVVLAIGYAQANLAALLHTVAVRDADLGRISTDYNLPTGDG